ncbi:hypothetical protein RJ55_08116 [Drechmeria coniospora]|nr:hypothetical protein RJ55_08116 [Drechmeria coniospora]
MISPSSSILARMLFIIASGTLLRLLVPNGQLWRKVKLSARIRALYISRNKLWALSISSLSSISIQTLPIWPEYFYTLSIRACKLQTATISSIIS